MIWKQGDKFYINLPECEKYYEKHADKNEEWIKYCRKNEGNELIVSWVTINRIATSTYQFDLNEVMSHPKQYEFRKQLKALFDEGTHDLTNLNLS